MLLTELVVFDPGQHSVPLFPHFTEMLVRVDVFFVGLELDALHVLLQAEAVGLDKLRLVCLLDPEQGFLQVFVAVSFGSVELEGQELILSSS